MTDQERDEQAIIDGIMLRQTQCLLDAFLVASRPEFLHNPEWASWLQDWHEELRVWFTALKKGQQDATSRN